MSRFAVILPAAGKSTRFGEQEKKVFTALGGKPVWLRSVELFVNRHDVCQTLLVIAPDDEEIFRIRYGAHASLLSLDLVLGGDERFESVANALTQIGNDIDLIAIHDAARPCLPPSLVDAVFAAASETGAAMLAVPVADTVKRADDKGNVTATVPRQGLWLAQTPQVFRRDWLLDAYNRRVTLGRDITDDAQLLEAAGHTVRLVTGSTSNLKITNREDLVLAEALLAARSPAATPRPSHPFADEEGQW
jgi:2-C-methyl-D-erythritol 4-phosphate cytidylyltransferase